MELPKPGKKTWKITPLGVVSVLASLALASLIFVWFFPLSLILVVVAAVASAVLALRRGINSASRSPLHVAASRGEVQRCRQLIEAGTPVDQASAFGDTALIFAASQGHTDTVAYLLSQGANPNVHGEGGRTALIAAVQNETAGQLDVVAQLAKSGAEVDAPDKSRLSALAHAVQLGKAEAVRLLLDCGASATQGHFVGENLFSLLSLVPASKPEIGRMLEAAGAHETLAEWKGEF